MPTAASVEVIQRCVVDEPVALNAFVPASIRPLGKLAPASDASDEVGLGFADSPHSPMIVLDGAQLGLGNISDDWSSLPTPKSVDRIGPAELAQIFSFLAVRPLQALKRSSIKSEQKGHALDLWGKGIRSDQSRSSSVSAAFASVETGTPSAVAIPVIVAQVGLPSPRSISESMFNVIPASSASVSRVAPCFWRNSRIALPRAGCGRGV